VLNKKFLVVMGTLLASSLAIAGHMSEKSLAERTAPDGKVYIKGQAREEAPAQPAAAPEKKARSGEAVYNTACVACHGAGVAGAPKFGDIAAWKDRIAKGEDTLFEHAIKGFQGSAGMMPPKGGCMDCSDDEIKAAVVHMMLNSQ